MSHSREHLFRRFEDLGIDSAVAYYPRHRTVEEGKMLRGEMPGAFTKNLLLKDKKDRLFLVVTHEDETIEIKTLHKRIGANGLVNYRVRRNYYIVDRLLAAAELRLGADPQQVVRISRTRQRFRWRCVRRRAAIAVGPLASRSWSA